MRSSIWLISLLALSGCFSRPCSVAAPPPPCKATGSNSLDWKTATAICRTLEETGAEVQRADVRGTHLSLTFAESFGGHLLADKVTLRQSVGGFLSLMSEESGFAGVSVEVISGERTIASGSVLDSGEQQIKIVEEVESN